MSNPQHKDFAGIVVDLIADAPISCADLPEPSSLLTLRHPGGRGSEASAEREAMMRFLTGRSRRFSSRSAREVMLTLNIDFASRAQFLDHLFQRPAGLSFAFAGGTAHR